MLLLLLDSSCGPGQRAGMADSRVRALLNCVGVTQAEEGWLGLPDSRTLSLHVSHSGVSLTVTRVRTLRDRDAFVEARTSQGELYVLMADDIFAVVVEGTKEAARKAGFV